MSEPQDISAWLAQERNGAHAAASSDRPWYELGTRNPPYPHIHEDYVCKHFHVQSHEQPHQGILSRFIETMFALAVSCSVALLLALFGVFLPTDGIPALVYIPLVCLAILCLFCLPFVLKHTYRWLIAFGVGFGFYLIWVLVFQA